jgi:hypothetical protein
MSRYVFVLALLSVFEVFAHGEDQLGPHGGHIRMPGAFHTELVAEGETSFKVYLLDVQFKNPSTKNSSVRAEIKFKNESLAVACKAMKNLFSCTLPNGRSLKGATEIALSSDRGVAKGTTAVYKWPLDSASQSSSH